MACFLGILRHFPAFFAVLASSLLIPILRPFFFNPKHSHFSIFFIFSPSRLSFHNLCHNLCSKVGATHPFSPSNLNLPFTAPPPTGMLEKQGQVCCGLAQSEGVLDAPLALIPFHLFWFLVILVGACVGGSDLVFLLRCGAFGAEIWLGISLCCMLENSVMRYLCRIQRRVGFLPAATLVVVGEVDVLTVAADSYLCMTGFRIFLFLLFCPFVVWAFGFPQLYWAYLLSLGLVWYCYAVRISSCEIK